MSTMNKHCELPQAGEVFNLAGQTAEDPWRIERERIEAEDRRRIAAEYQRRMQLALELCPGFCACDAPNSDDAKGVVMVEPGRVCEAWAWLRRRFHVCESLELSTDMSIAIKIAPRIRRVTSRRHRVKVRFGPVEQFTLALE